MSKETVLTEAEILEILSSEDSNKTDWLHALLRFEDESLELYNEVADSSDCQRFQGLIQNIIETKQSFIDQMKELLDTFIDEDEQNLKSEEEPGDEEPGDED